MTAPNPSPPEVWTRCRCGAVVRLAEAGYWALCSCGRAVRWQGTVESVESADEWARREP